MGQRSKKNKNKAKNPGNETPRGENQESEKEEIQAEESKEESTLATQESEEIVQEQIISGNKVPVSLDDKEVDEEEKNKLALYEELEQ